MPLGAIDLGDKNATIYDNSSINESDSVIEDANQTETVDIDDVSDEEKSLLKKDTPAFLIYVDDCDYGEKIHVTIKSSFRFTTYVFFRIEGIDKEYRIPVIHGDGSADIDWDVHPGTFTATGTSYETKELRSVTKTTTFTIRDNRTNPNLSLKVENTTLGRYPFVEIHSSPGFDRTLNLKLDNSDKTYSVKMNDGYGNLTLDRDLSIGNHTVSFVFNGDDEFAYVEKKASFSYRKPLELRIDPKPISVGKCAFVNVYSDKGFHLGHADVKIYSSDYEYNSPVIIMDGYGTLGLVPLSSGNYTAKVKFDGNDEYIDEVATSYFSID